MQTVQSIERQIFQLQKKVNVLESANLLTKDYYALKGKIKNLETKLQKVRYEEFLSR